MLPRAMLGRSSTSRPLDRCTARPWGPSRSQSAPLCSPAPRLLSTGGFWTRSVDPATRQCPEWRPVRSPNPAPSTLVVGDDCLEFTSLAGSTPISHPGLSMSIYDRRAGNRLLRDHGGDEKIMLVDLRHRLALW